METRFKAFTAIVILGLLMGCIENQGKDTPLTPSPQATWIPVHSNGKALTAAEFSKTFTLVSPPIVINEVAKTTDDAKSECPQAIHTEEDTDLAADPKYPVYDETEYFLFKAATLPTYAFGTAALMEESNGTSVTHQALTAEEKKKAYYLKIERTPEAIADTYSAAIFVEAKTQIEVGHEWSSTNEYGKNVSNQGYEVRVDVTIPDPPLPNFVRESGKTANPCLQY